MKKENQKKQNGFLEIANTTKYILLSAFVYIIFLQIANAQTGSGVDLPKGTGLSEKSFPEILAGLVSWLLLIFGFVAIISFIITGIMYLTARGDDKTAETAKKQLTYSIIGVVVGLSGYIVLKAIDSWLKGSATF